VVRGPVALRERIELASVQVDRADRRTAVATLERFFADGGHHQIVTVNMDFIRIAQADHDFRRVLNAADLAVADGMPVVWLSRLRGAALPERVAGIDLINDCCHIAAQEGVGVFLLGAAPGVADAAARELLSRHPGLRVAGTYAPPFGPHSAEEDARMVAAIRAAGRCVLFVAFGAPRQDLFIARHLQELDIVVAIGVGCTFDILAGAVRRAPRWIQRSGFEWAWRMAMEPRRLWRRYLTLDAPLLGVLAAAAVRDALAAGQSRQ
jgi:N-acetylglucosaminyldiphosphoundecaprenol N-acetyl-beta-D-mannosaminyltransferase